jgi:hypothetical protein
MRFLPGFFPSVAPHVDGIVALDDGSSDGSREFVAAQPGVLEVLHIPAGTHGDNQDSILRRRLIEAAWEHDADWLLGIDADERLEYGFRQRAEAELARADALDVPAMWVPFKELWDASHYRTDGVWGQKRKACLFRSTRAHQFDTRRVHSFWASVPPPEGGWPEADLRIYHLRMIDPADRRARAERYERIDPDHVWQPIGYDYLLDEAGLELAEVEPERGYLIPARRTARRNRGRLNRALRRSSRTSSASIRSKKRSSE